MSDRPVREIVAPARRLLEPLERFVKIEAASGIVLIVAALAALLWANSPWAHSYHDFWHAPVTLGVGPWVSSQSLHFWINEGLMSIFFLVVGLEIRREIHEGALSTLRQAALPAVAALGGVMVPALIYFAFASADPQLRHGWAIPTATDIAFAVGVLTLLGRRVPPALRAMLLALAIIDDIAAIVIIGLFYSTGVTFAALGIAALGLIIALLFQRLGIRSAWIYVIPGFVTWIGMLGAGVHPAIAGVLLGLITPVAHPYAVGNALDRAADALRRFGERSRKQHSDPHHLSEPLHELRDAEIDLLPPAHRVELALHPWVAFGVMPLFALANAGVTLSGLEFDRPFVTVAGGVALGLFLGKPLGILLATLVGVRLGLCKLPAGVTRSGILVLGCLGGIGFTMSIFIAELSFSNATSLAAAKFAVLGASTAAAVVGFALGRVLLPMPRAAG
jgi:NhaA family Na+:H+ antiporter